MAPSIRVFEPALCCNTGVCGPDVDESLVRFTADLDHLKRLGVDIARHNLANDPAAFVADPLVASFLSESGSAGLPLVLVDGVPAAAGSYPDRDELSRLAGLAVSADAATISPVAGRQDLGLVAAQAAEGSCCAPTDVAGSGCC